MSFGNSHVTRVASLRQRAVYKTEFDIFKQTCDIDLVSLLTYEDDNEPMNGTSKIDVRPYTVQCTNAQRTAEVVKERTSLNQDAAVYGRHCIRKRISKSATLSNTKSTTHRPIFNKIVNLSNNKNEMDSKAFVKTSQSVLSHRNVTIPEKKIIARKRTCKSAYSLIYNNASNKVHSRSLSTCELRREHKWVKDAKNINNNNSVINVSSNPSYTGLTTDVCMFSPDANSSEGHQSVPRVDNVSELTETKIDSNSTNDTTENYDSACQCKAKCSVANLDYNEMQTNDCKAVHNDQIDTETADNLASANTFEAIDSKDRVFASSIVPPNYDDTLGNTVGFLKVDSLNDLWIVNKQEHFDLNDADKLAGTIEVPEQNEDAFDSTENEEFSWNQDVQNIGMSREARHALFETLQDMCVNKKHVGYNDSDVEEIRHMDINAQNDIKDDGTKYNNYMKERSRSSLRNHFQSMDSLGNDDNSSYSSAIKECDETSNNALPPGKLSPINVRENSKVSKVTSSSSRNKVKQMPVKQTKYKIPEIRNYKMVISMENDFQITPLGFDIRYEPRPYISKEEQEEMPPKYVSDYSIQKCTKWLENVILSR